MKLSNSELRSFKNCRRNWWLTYVRRLHRRHDGPGPLAIGNMVHHVLEWYYTLRAMGKLEEASAYTEGPWRETLSLYVGARIDELEATGGDQHVPGMLADAELAAIMVEGYFEWIAEEGVDAQFDVVGAEQELEAYLGNIEGEDIWLISKLDLLAVLRDTGEALFLDHKSVQNLGDLPKGAHLDEQQLTYGLVQRILIAAGQLDAPRAVGGVLNMLRKVKRTARANPPFYGRASVRHNEIEFENFYRRIWFEVRDLIRLRREVEADPANAHLIAYPNPTRDCSWKCPFFGVCGQFDDGSDVEFVLADMFEEHDPYERYSELEKQ